VFLQLDGAVGSHAVDGSLADAVSHVELNLTKNFG
jgi:hypothetical protein